MVHSGLVGRDRETDALDGWLAAALRGEPRLVLCRGEQGIGKTRLGEELVARAVARGVATAWGRSAEADGAPPYWPWRQVLRGTPGVARLAGELGVAADVAPLAPEASASSPPDDTGGEERFRLFDAVSRVLHAAAAPRGLLIVLDDVQWADRPSLLLLLHLARQLRGGRLMLLATHHDLPAVDGADPLGEVLPELVREPVTDRVELTGLTRAAVAELLDLRSAESTPAGGSAPPVTADLVARVHELTGGNPFFVGELARYLAAGRPGIPPSVRDAIARRMDRLSPRCRHQLRAASIVGRQFSVAVVAAVIGQPVLDCLDPLDEAVAAGFVEPSATAGDHQFVHALVRDAVEAGLPTSERVRLHRAAVEAIERFHADRLDPHLSDLARHWAAAAVAGERARAAGWIEQAGDEAMRRLAFEEGARFYRLALDTGDPELDGLAQHRLLVALADARHRSADRAGSAEACLAAAAVARGLGRPDLLGDAVLVLGCVNDTGADRTLRALCEESLAGLGDEPSARRARLLALLAETHMYLEDVGLADLASRDALAVADACGDTTALVDALRARQMARSGPDGDAERAALTERMFAVGSGVPSTRMWAHLWRIDTCVERGELFDAGAELDRLAWSAGQVGGPTGRWHVLKVTAALAQAHGRFADARLLADEAFAATPEGGHAGSVGSRMVLLTALDHHTGAEHGGTTAMAALDAAGGAVAAGSGYRITYTLGPAVILTDAGRLDEAGALYRSLGPPRSWRPPPFFLLACDAAGIAVAIGQGASADVAVLRERLAPYRHLHVGSGAGVANYGGPVALHLGMAASHLGDLDTAVGDLRLALTSCRDSGAAGYAVEAQVELVAVLVRRGRSDDLDEARALAADAAAAASGLGMAPFTTRLASVAAKLGPAPPAASLLTAREREVAACLRTGMSNPQIAAALFVSERTAQNHVQHILSKLGYSRRSQIAVWAVHNLDHHDIESHR